MDRISELCIREPALFPLLDDPSATGEEQDGRFHLANMLLGVLEEAHTQHALEKTMSDNDPERLGRDGRGLLAQALRRALLDPRCPDVRTIVPAFRERADRGRPCSTVKRPPAYQASVDA